MPPKRRTSPKRKEELLNTDSIEYEQSGDEGVYMITYNIIEDKTLSAKTINSLEKRFKKLVGDLSEDILFDYLEYHYDPNHTLMIVFSGEKLDDDDGLSATQMYAKELLKLYNKSATKDVKLTFGGKKHIATPEFLTNDDWVSIFTKLQDLKITPNIKITSVDVSDDNTAIVHFGKLRMPSPEKTSRGRQKKSSPLSTKRRVSPRNRK